MIINEIRIRNEGYVRCQSNYYSAQDGLPHNSLFVFSSGINKLVGEIDSGVWAVSYLVSMYPYQPQDFVLFEKSEAYVNNKNMSLTDLAEYACYMDKSYPLFSSKRSVRDLVSRGLKKHCLSHTSDDIRELFSIDSERYDRPLNGVGNEIFKAMAAIGYSHNKQVFCFPWLSQTRFESYHRNITDLLDLLAEKNKMVIFPVGDNPQHIQFSK